MIGSLFGKSLRDQRVAVLGYGLGMAVFVAVIFAVYPSIEGMAEFQRMIDSYPAAMKAFLGEMAGIGTIEGFVSMELTSFMYPLLLAVFAITLGSGAIAGEEDRGTLDLLMSNPLPRWRLVAEKFGVLIAGLVAIALITAFAMWASALAISTAMSTGGIMSTTLGAVPLGLIVGSYSLLFSCWLRSRRSAIFAASGLTIGLYFLNTLVTMVESLKGLQRLSPFYYYSGYGTLTRGINWEHAGLLLAATVVLFLFALFAFDRREVYA